MPSPLTLRLDDRTWRRILRIAERKRVSASAVIREAIEVWIDQQETKESPFEGMSDLIGVVRGGRPNRSVQTGRQFAELLKTRRKRH